VGVLVIYVLVCTVFCISTAVTSSCSSSSNIIVKDVLTGFYRTHYCLLFRRQFLKQYIYKCNFDYKIVIFN
jgi:hypothetical protein